MPVMASPSPAGTVRSASREPASLCMIFGRSIRGTILFIRAAQFPTHLDMAVYGTASNLALPLLVGSLDAILHGDYNLTKPEHCNRHTVAKLVARR